jgi:hypothetical protein
MDVIFHVWVDVTINTLRFSRYSKTMAGAHSRNPFYNSFTTIGQNEPTITNAPIGRSIHWMGYVFSFGKKMGFITIHFFSLLTTALFFWGLFLVIFSMDPTSHITTLFTFLSS